MNNYLKKTESLSDSDRHHWPHLESVLFLLIIFIETGIFFYLIRGRNFVGGHDAFQCFTGQYYFLSNVVNYDEIPQWSAFLTHGNMVTIGYLSTMGILPNILLLTGDLLKDINFLPIFYAGYFIDELLLLVGVWLLGRRFFASPFTVFFVSLSVMGSCIWVIQPWFNFHFYYAIPLILYFFHIFFDSGKWRFFFLAANLLFIQYVGNHPYFLSVTSLVIFLYFLFYLAFKYREIWQKAKTLDFGWPFVSTIIFIIFSFIILYIATYISVDHQVASYNPKRNSDWSAPLNVFLNYAAKLSWKTWIEMVLGVSPCLDYTLYIGIICFPFILLGSIFNIYKKNVHFFLTVVILIFFSTVPLISVLFYYCWPMMKYFRHLSLLSPLIKVFLCFLAGFGFDAVFFNKSRLKNPLVMKFSLAVVCIFMLGSFFALSVMSDQYHFMVAFVRSMIPKGLPALNVLFNKNIMTFLLGRTTFFCLMGFILFACLFFINRKKYFFPLIIFLLTLHVADIYGFKLSEIKLKTTPLNDELYKITEFQSMPYPKRRDISFWENNPRADLLKFLPIRGTIYWTTHGLLFKDQLGNPFRTSLCLSPLDNYMKAYWGQPIHDLSTKPHGLFHPSGPGTPRLEFPRHHPAALKISGVAEDKIQFFSEAEFIASEEKIASNITDPDYKGDIIFLSPIEKNKEKSSISEGSSSENDLSTSNRLRFPYQVQRFDANNLVITTNVYSWDSVWLLYSDVWHPFWKATVNGKETPVYKANLAYKAVRLEKGFNKVHFYFKSAWVSLFHWFVGFNSLFWLIIIISLIWRIIFTFKKPRGDKLQNTHQYNITGR